MATVAPEVPVFGRDEAFERLYRQYVKDVYHYALALLRNPADAEDVTQTTFMNAYRAFRQGQEIRKPQNWLIKIAHNVARSRYSRQARRVKEVPLDDHAEQLAAPSDDKPDVESVLQALAALPFNQRAALVMRELEGRSYAEISDTIGVSVPAVETLIFRARRSLRVRASALKSIAAIPLPTSLTELFGGGGGAVAGGIGGGFLVKAAVALVAGAVATGIGSDRGNRAAAAPGTQQSTVASASPRAAAPATRTQRLAKASRRAAAKTHVRPARRIVGSAVHRRSVFRGVSAPAPQPEVSHPASQAAPPARVVPPPAAPLPAAGQTVGNAVETVNQAVNQAVEKVTEALPVPVPQVPLQAPNLPKLP
jgi:RNA polymerase sigma factor (sigma-70 family)